MHRHGWSFALVGGVVALAAPALAETWKARAELIQTKSASGCNERLSVYTLTLEGSTFSATDVDGKQFTIDVPDNGVIKEDYDYARSSNPTHRSSATRASDRPYRRAVESGRSSPRSATGSR